MKASELPIGSKLLFGRYLSDLRWTKVSENGYMITSGGVIYSEADSPEPENVSAARRARGSNFFPQTNICTLLNSEKANWYVPQHEQDNVSDRMGEFPGFLRNFDSWELDLLMPQEITVTVPKGFRREFGEQFKTTVRVSLPALSQLFAGEDETEGSRLDFFREGNPVPKDILTRTACGTGLYVVAQNRRPIARSPVAESAIAPLIFINPDADVEFDQREGCFYVLPPQSYQDAIASELLQLLK